MVLALALLAGGCASPRAGTGAADPLFGIGAGTPEVLARVAKAPYETPQPATCDEIERQIETLDQALGPDVDAGDAVNDGSQWVTDAVQVLIPYRGAVRLVTGAKRAERKRAAAFLAASVRRGYLKGMRLSLGCSLT